MGKRTIVGCLTTVTPFRNKLYKRNFQRAGKVLGDRDEKVSLGKELVQRYSFRGHKERPSRDPGE